MSKIMEDRINDRITDEKVRIAARLLQMGKATVEETAELTELSVEDIKDIQEQIKTISE